MAGQVTVDMQEMAAELLRVAGRPHDADEAEGKTTISAYLI